MPGVLRVTCLNGLLGAHVNGDGNDGQDTDVPEKGQTVIKRTRPSPMGSESKTGLLIPPTVEGFAARIISTFHTIWFHT